MSIGGKIFDRKPEGSNHMWKKFLSWLSKEDTELQFIAGVDYLIPNFT